MHHCPIFLTHEGRRQSLSDWAKEIDIPYSTLLWRYRKGWSVEEVVTTKPFQKLVHNSPKLICHEGKTQSMYAWAKELGIEYNTLRWRLGCLNWPLDKVFAKKTWKSAFNVLKVSLSNDLSDNKLTAYEVFRDEQRLGRVWQVRTSYWMHSEGKNWQQWRSRCQAVIDLVQILESKKQTEV